MKEAGKKSKGRVVARVFFVIGLIASVSIGSLAATVMHKSDSMLGLINYDNASDEVLIGRDFGLKSRGYGEKVAGTIDEEVKRIIDECYLKARTLIQEYHPVLEKCAQLLLEKEKITRSEFEALFADSEVEG